MKPYYRNLSSVMLLTLCIIITGKINAQDYKNQFGIYTTGIFSSLTYDMNFKGKHEVETGFGVGINYTYFFTKNFGLSLGGELQTYKSQAYYDKLTDQYAATDLDNHNFIFNYQATGYKEKQHASFLYIPLNFIYETPGITGFYMAAGAKIGFPIKSTAQTSIQNLQTYGYYPQWDATLYDPAFMGYKTEKNIELPKQDITLKTDIAFNLEAGVKQQLNAKNSIYIGLFIAMGITNLEEAPSEKLITYHTDTPALFTYNTLVNSKLQKEDKAFISNIKTFSSGVKLAYKFNW
ncbi:MAG: hypothetical protein ACTJGD_11235 [Mesonia hippocampi]|uniref:hypothetical protein n=1 Tax=Mesonia hippocampi TaxID=1628250 RepID=UPI003F985869